jgi:hypothetical protein
MGRHARAALAGPSGHARRATSGLTGNGCHMSHVLADEAELDYAELLA